MTCVVKVGRARAGAERMPEAGAGDVFLGVNVPLAPALAAHERGRFRIMILLKNSIDQKGTVKNTTKPVHLFREHLL